MQGCTEYGLQVLNESIQTEKETAMRKKIFFVTVFPILLPLTIVADSSAGYRPVIDELITTVEKHFYDSSRVSGSKWNRRAKQLKEFGDTATNADQVSDSINALLGTLKASHTHYYSKGDPKRYRQEE